MSLLRGRLFAGALFAGTLWGGAQIVAPPEELPLFASGAGGGVGGGPDAQVTLSEWRRRHLRRGSQHQIHAPGAAGALHHAPTTATHPRRRRQRMEDELLLLSLLQ